MLVYELFPLVGDVDTIVEVGAGSTVRDLLLPRDGVKSREWNADDGAALDAGSLLTGFIGPDPEKHIAPEALVPALQRLPVGGRVVLLVAWPVADLPYHLLLGPLVDAQVQVLQVVPLDKVQRHGAHCAVIAARVERLAPLRTHLDDSPITVPGAEPDLRALLRLAGEHLFGDLVARPARRRLAEMRAQDKRIHQLERDVEARDRKIASVQRRVETVQNDLARLRASTTFRVGDAFVQGARRPGRALVSVPASLVRAWRGRGEVTPANGHPSAADRSELRTDPGATN
jgi:hypothetical protein